jgi:DNA-binding LacI/PurR family transcriptional regulator
MSVVRWKEITDAIAAEIDSGRLTPGTWLPTETELAAQWNVSRVTAHRAMHELQLSGRVVRKRHVGTVVSAPGTHRLGRIAVFLNTRDLLEQEYLSGIQSVLPDAFDLILCDIRGEAGREAHYLKRMCGTTDGIICIPTCMPENTGLLNDLLQGGTNLVLMDCVPSGVQAPAVISDNYAGSLSALRFLVERGHRRIAHFTVDRPAISSLSERLEAYRLILREIEAPDERRWLRAFPYEVVWEPGRPNQAIADALAALHHLPDRPTAIFCAHDYILAPILLACHALRIAVPEDLEIVSFNDCQAFVPYPPGNIHRIVQRARESGRLAAERLCRRMAGEPADSTPVRVSPLFFPAESISTPANPLASSSGGLVSAAVVSEAVVEDRLHKKGEPV